MSYNPRKGFGMSTRRIQDVKGPTSYKFGIFVLGHDDMPSEADLRAKDKGTSYRIRGVCLGLRSGSFGTDVGLKINEFTTVFEITTPIKGGKGKKLGTGDCVQMFLGNVVTVSFFIKETNKDPYLKLKEVRNGMIMEVENFRADFYIHKESGERRYQWKCFSPSLNIGLFCEPAGTQKVVSTFPQTIFTSYIRSEIYEKLRELSIIKVPEGSVKLPAPAPGAKEKTADELTNDLAILLDNTRKGFVKNLIAATPLSGMLGTFTFQCRPCTMDDVRAFREITGDPKACIMWKMKIPDDPDHFASYWSYISKKKDAKPGEPTEEVYAQAKFQYFFKLSFKDPNGVQRVHAYDVVINVIRNFSTKQNETVGFVHDLLQINDTDTWIALAFHSCQIPKTFFAFCPEPSSGSIDIGDDDDEEEEQQGKGGVIAIPKTSASGMDPRIIEYINDWMDREDDKQQEPLDIPKEFIEAKPTDTYHIDLTASGVYTGLAGYVLRRGLPVSHRRACEILRKLWCYKVKKDNVPKKEYLFEYEINPKNGKIKSAKNSFDPKLHRDGFAKRLEGLFLPYTGDSRGNCRLESMKEGYDRGIINVGEFPYKSFEDPKTHMFKLLTNAAISEAAYEALSKFKLEQQEEIVEELLDAAHRSAPPGGVSLSENAQTIASLGFHIPSAKKFKFAIYSLIDKEIPKICEAPLLDLKLPRVTLPLPVPIKYKRGTPAFDPHKALLSTPHFEFENILSAPDAIKPLSPVSEAKPADADTPVAATENGKEQQPQTTDSTTTTTTTTTSEKETGTPTKTDGNGDDDVVHEESSKRKKTKQSNRKASNGRNKKSPPPPPPPKSKSSKKRKHEELLEEESQEVLLDYNGEEEELYDDEDLDNQEPEAQSEMMIIDRDDNGEEEEDEEEEEEEPPIKKQLVKKSSSSSSSKKKGSSSKIRR